MLRTKDLVLFVLTLLFLGIAISSTVWFETMNNSSPAVEQTDFVANMGTSTASAPEVALLDRAARIKDLRDKIAADTSTITPAPSVEGPTVSDVPDENDTPAAASSVQRCLYPDDILAKVPQWPLSGVQFKVVEGARLVTHVTSMVPDTTGSSTDVLPQTISHTLLTMPMTVQPLATPHCLPSEIVGVSISGYLMFNSDVRAFKGLTSEMLIGYARDGYPIYGPYSGQLDACGGYQSSTGYRYSLAPDRDYVLGCFMGNPASFTL